MSTARFTFGQLTSRWRTGDLKSRWTFGGVVPLSMSTLDLRYARIPVSATVAGAPYNPTGDTVRMAFMASGAKPGPSDWQTATWETDTTRGLYWAICLVGPAGTITLPVGVYTVWVKITDSPEIPAGPVDTLTVY